MLSFFNELVPLFNVFVLVLVEVDEDSAIFFNNSSWIFKSHGAQYWLSSWSGGTAVVDEVNDDCEPDEVMVLVVWPIDGGCEVGTAGGIIRGAGDGWTVDKRDIELDDWFGWSLILKSHGEL